MANMTIGGSEFSEAYYGWDPISKMYYGSEQVWPTVVPVVYDLSINIVAVLSTVSNNALVTVDAMVGSENKYIDWGDGSTTVDDSSQLSHYYTTAGSYNIRCAGCVTQGYSILTLGGDSYITDIVSYGNVFNTNAYRAFYYEEYMTSIPSTWAGLELVTETMTMFDGNSALIATPTSWTGLDSLEDATSMFRDCISLVNIPTTDLTALSNLTDGDEMFKDCSSLTSDIYSLYLYLSTKTIPVDNHNQMFDGCVNAIGYENVPVSWGGLGIPAEPSNADTDAYDVATTIVGNYGEMYLLRYTDWPGRTNEHWGPSLVLSGNGTSGAIPPLYIEAANDASSSFSGYTTSSYSVYQVLWDSPDVDTATVINIYLTFQGSGSGTFSLGSA